MSTRGPRGLLRERQSPLWSIGRGLVIAAGTTLLFVAALSVAVLVTA